MQGDRAEDSIVDALHKCADDASGLDIVVIVRGGGGQVDLHCFDSYEIGKAIALLPVPVVSGIGHQRDSTVVDEVSNRREKTPTAVADMIVTSLKDYEEKLDSSAHNLVHGARNLTSNLKGSLLLVSKRFEIAVRNELQESVHRLATLSKGLQYCLKFLKNEALKLKARDNSVKHLNPKNILKRGFSITYCNSKAAKTIHDVTEGDELRTVLYDGEVLSRVEQKKKGRQA
jgi:exodeoxyribonuclease VII large subunit